MATSILEKLRGFLRMWLHAQEGRRDAGLPAEPSVDALMNLCCGPRLLSKALNLHGEDLSADPGNSRPAEPAQPPG